MAFDFSKLNFFNRLDARARVFVLFAGVIGLIFAVYLGTKYFFTSTSAVGASHVASAPAGLQSVPGGKTTSAYYQAILQANAQKEQQAKMTGGSAIPTMINQGQPAPNANCNIICSEQMANVKDLLDDWVRTGKVSPEVAQELEDLANKNVPVSEYEAELNRLVKEGKLTPEQARELLEQYKKQHANALLQESAKVMDGMIKSGDLPLDAANELLAAQKRGVSAADYAAILQRLVKEGKISPQTAARLLAQYSQQLAKEAAKQNLATIAQMQANGEITPDVAKQLADLANRNVSVDDYARALQNLVAQGKLTPEAAAKLLEAYKKTKLGLGAGAQLQQMIHDAENAAYNELAELLKAGRITQDVASQLTALIQKNVTLDDFKAAITQLVQQKKLSPDIAQLKIGDYTKIRNLRDEAVRLAALQAANATPAQYADELRKAVAAGIFTPDEAAQMLQDYQALTAAPALAPVTTGVGGAAFANLQSRLQAPQQAAQGTTAASFTAEQLQAQQQIAQARQERIQDLMSRMQSQSGQLISAWAPPTMQHFAGSGSLTTTGAAGAGGGAGAASSSTTTTTTTTSTGAPLIKAGTIIFGVLDTEANSDYPDSPVMVTIVEGQYKGSKLLGKLVTTKGVAGQLDRITLNFTLMNNDAWPSSKTVTAYAIDPDTARSVMASSVDYHYLERYGAIFATSLLQGYSQAIQTSASTSTTGIFGTSTTHPELNPSQKLAVAFGQIGQNLSSVTQNFINIPPTVRVNAGVSLGILFMGDVSAS